MKPIEPASSTHACPVLERDCRFVLGRIIEGRSRLVADFVPRQGSLAAVPGRWECDLVRNELTWSDEVYDLFGLPRAERVTRNEAVSFYCEHSRAVMEGLRRHAIRTNSCFVLDAEIRPRHFQRRWMRLVAEPIVENGIVVRLRGTKQPL